jgi:protein-S-isoprenylcysteine O-methyltransferase Ste14
MNNHTEHADHASVKIHPPVLVSVHVLTAFFLHKLFPLPFAFPQVFVWIGYALVLIGLGLTISAASGFMRARTTLDPHGSVSSLVTSGPYHFTRNPIYLGFVCLLIGFPLVFRIYWGLILSPLLMVLMNMLVIQYEEVYLERKFGEVYTNYKSRVRRWL